MALTGNGAMVNALKEVGAIRSDSVEAAFRAVDRRIFAGGGDDAYSDAALPTLGGQTISAPSVVAIMLELLEVRPGMNVLEIGTGSGYNTALLAQLTGPAGKVVTIELNGELAAIAMENTEKAGGRRNIEFVIGDGSGGLSRFAPYDRIIVTAAMPGIGPSHPLIRQLKPDGRLVAPVGDKYLQKLVLYDARTGVAMRALDVVFVPLVGTHGFPGP